MAFYGRMTLGLDDYLERLVRAEQDVDQVVTDMLEGKKIAAVNLMWKYLRESSEQWTGATGRTLFFEGPTQDGNYIFIELGAHTDVDPSAFYKEYGRPKQAAESFLRPTLQFYRTRGLRQWMEAALERLGVPSA